MIELLVTGVILSLLLFIASKMDTLNREGGIEIELLRDILREIRKKN